MSFDTAHYLGKATARAKSDVANKMVSMFLHEISRRIVMEVGLRVTDTDYIQAVEDTFGDQCMYCRRPLEPNRAAVEHLDGMNRFRAGLHVPGNVAIACVACNREKRRDDQVKNLVLAQSGWESFLAHNAQECLPSCKTCNYWTSVWPDRQERSRMLILSRERIMAFRNRYSSTLQWSTQAKLLIREQLECLYRECQEFATERISALVDDAYNMMRCGQPRQDVDLLKPA